MRGRPAPLAPLVVLGLLGAIAAGRIAAHDPLLRLELGAVKLTALAPETRARLARLPDTVFLTLYLSARERLPSEMRRLERDATSLFEALARASGGKVGYQVLDPGADPEIERYAARRGVVPQRVRSVERDGYSEKTVWSSLGIAFGARDPVLVAGLRPEHVPRLQALVMGYLEQLERPARPVVALAAAAGLGTEGLAAALGRHAEVRRIDLDGGARLPADADLLVWLEPERIERERQIELERFLDDGRSIVVADGALRVAGLQAAPGGEPVARLERDPLGAAPFLAELGLSARAELLCDARSQSLPLGGVERNVPFFLRCIAQNQDFRTFVGQPNGHLLFHLPAVFGLDAAVLRERALSAEVLASSSDETWIAPLPDGGVALSELRPEAGRGAARSPLMVALRPDDPGRGLLVACASSSPFVDGLFEIPRTAHAVLVDVLLETLGSDERLVMGRMDIERPRALPPLPAAERAAWRAACVLLVPVLLLALALRRGALRRPREQRPRTERRVRPVLAGAGLLLAALLAPAALRGAALRVDLTADGLNELSPASRALAAQVRGERAVRAEWVVSEADRLPLELRSGMRRLRTALSAWSAAGARVDSVVTRPDEADEAGLAALAARGLRPAPVTRRDEEVTTVRTVWCSLALSDAGGERVLDFHEAADFENLEFRLALAFWQLANGRRPHVALATDAPRLTAAEVHQQYQAQGLIAPTGTDVYSLARARLARDFRVSHVTPGAPEVPADADALVWLQPRRAVEPMLEATLRWLMAGGRALIAAQHFGMQSQQFPENNFKVVHWPQPQTIDIDERWLDDLGVQLVREVFFDASFTTASLSAQVDRGGAREPVVAQVAQPFLVRVGGAGLDDGSPVTRLLGDQVLPYPSFVRLDEQRLAERGLSARVLMRSSATSWSLPWQGGFIPDEALAGPPRDDRGRPAGLGSVPLAVRIDGRFPPPPAPLLPPEFARPWPPRALADGTLLLVGCSEMFKNDRLLEPAFRADHLLVNAVAELALPAELAALAGRRPVARGFLPPAPEARLAWRAAVIGGMPLALLGFGLVLRLLRRRSAA